MTIICSRCGGEHMRSECPASGAVNEELRYAHRLATALWEKHYKADAPDWRPLPDLLGTLTQIDNMCSGLTRFPANEDPSGQRREPMKADPLDDDQPF